MKINVQIPKWKTFQKSQPKLKVIIGFTILFYFYLIIILELNICRSLSQRRGSAKRRKPSLKLISPTEGMQIGGAEWQSTTGLCSNSPLCLRTRELKSKTKEWANLDSTPKVPLFQHRKLSSYLLIWNLNYTIICFSIER